jgi:Mg2+-importing ATPase
MGTTPQGLTAEEAAARLRIVGPNLIAHDRQQSPLAELIGRARNPLNFLLLSLAAVSFFLGDRRAAAVITVMVVLSVTLAFVQEHRSNNAAARLRAMSARPRRCCDVALTQGPSLTALKSQLKSSYPEMSSGLPPVT